MHALFRLRRRPWQAWIPRGARAGRGHPQSDLRPSETLLPLHFPLAVAHRPAVRLRNRAVKDRTEEINEY